jgi:hypothetical protein
LSDEKKPYQEIRITGERESSPDFQPFPEPVAERGTAKRFEQDVRMMKSPQHWPHAVLPMKRFDPVKAGLQTAVWDGKALHVDALMAFGTVVQAGTESIEQTPEWIVTAGWTVD